MDWRNKMIEERYSIEVGEETVEIYGYLTIEEVFDFINFFDKKGYRSITPGCENSTIRLHKKDEVDRRQDRLKEQKEEEEESYKFLYKKEEEHHKKTKIKLEEVERLIKTLMMEENDKVKNLLKNNEKLQQYNRLLCLKNNPEALKIIDNLNETEIVLT